jgi:hypothetical protein
MKNLAALVLAVSCAMPGIRVVDADDDDGTCAATTTWAGQTSATDNVWRDVTFGDGLFVAVASDGSGGRVMTSTDGIVWTSRASAADNNWFSVTFGNAWRWVIVETGTA